MGVLCKREDLRMTAVIFWRSSTLRGGRGASFKLLGSKLLLSIVVVSEGGEENEEETGGGGVGVTEQEWGSGSRWSAAISIGEDKESFSVGRATSELAFSFELFSFLDS